MVDNLQVHVSVIAQNAQCRCEFNVSKVSCSYTKHFKKYYSHAKKTFYCSQIIILIM